MIIDVGALEKEIRRVESLWEKDHLSLEERFLVVRHLNSRLQASIDRQKASDLQSQMVEGMNFKGLLKRFKKGDEDDDE